MCLFSEKISQNKASFSGKVIVHEDRYLGGYISEPVRYHASIRNGLCIISIMLLLFCIDLVLLCATDNLGLLFGRFESIGKTWA